MKRTEPQLIVLLAAGRTVRSAAKTCAMSERTIQRRLQDPDFQKRVAKARVDITARATAALADGASAAVRQLRRLLKAKSESVQLGACRAFLEFGLEAEPAMDLEQRVASLERRRYGHER